MLEDCATEAWPGKGIDTLIWRLREGVLERFEPDVCLLLIGANNMWRSLQDRRAIGPLAAFYWVWRLQRLLGEMRRQSPPDDHPRGPAGDTQQCAPAAGDSTGPASRC